MGIEFAEQTDWVFNVRRRFSWFVEYFQIFGTNRAVFRKVLGVDFAYSNMKKDADYNEFTDAKEDASSLALIEGKTGRDFSFLHEIAERSYKKSHELLSAAKKVSVGNFKDLSNAELKILFDGLALQMLEYQPIIFLIFPVEKYLEGRLKEEIKRIAGEKGMQSKLNDYLSVFSMPKEELVVIREEKSLLEIALAKKDGEPVDQLIAMHLRNFAWIPTDDPTGKPWTRQDLADRIDALLEFNLKERLEKLANGEKARANKLEQYAEELELSEKTLELVRLVREFVYLRNHRVECWVQMQFLARPFFEFIASKAGLSFGEFMALSHVEISDFLKTGSLISKEEIKSRLKAYSYIKLDEKCRFFFGDDAEKSGRLKSKEPKARKTKELKGSVANKGKAVGLVKVVRELSELPKVKKGDILVASMTVPQYIPAMEKAAAFVTDEGGITCHAAIVSRELDVPCIVGTGNASKVLKDGDLVEVNADEGTVKILKAAEE